MGVSFVPKTDEAMAELERLMDAPFPAWRAVRGLHGVLVSDNLFDMLDRCQSLGPDTDARPVVALELDEFVNWADASAWEAGVAERGRALVERFRDADIARHVDRLTIPATAEAATRAIAGVLDLSATAAAGRIDVRPGSAPGTFVALDAETGDAYRVEAVYGVVFEALPEVRERVEAEFASPAPTP